ncbi:polysaccharide biosynthesis/export family protein [Paraburkholderia caledonica]|uniref:Protein involved in polysaccharide export with SLBB domain n=1 Tax=Paraburkholderia caledonica TaxID=134536 RepID=A0AB73ILY4_9BURK|nr:protein involved in polysaccharide export with SLBB domain [Paraburkholderia caledonica]
MTAPALRPNKATYAISGSDHCRRQDVDIFPQFSATDLFLYCAGRSRQNSRMNRQATSGHNREQSNESADKRRTAATDGVRAGEVIPKGGRNMLMRRMVSIAASLWLAVLSSACATAPRRDTGPAGSGKSSPEKAGMVSIKVIDSELVLEQAKAPGAPTSPLASRFATPAEYPYRIAAQHILGVTVWDHPELTDSSGSNSSIGESTAKPGASGLLQPYTSALPSQTKPYDLAVDADGMIFFPFVGRIRAAGKTTGELRSQLASSLIPYIRAPQVDVRVLYYRSQKVQVTGRVKIPGPLAITDVPLSLVDAITRAGGTPLTRIRGTSVWCGMENNMCST